MMIDLNRERFYKELEKLIYQASEHDQLLTVTGYEKPTDLPDNYVLRAFYIEKKGRIEATEVCYLAETSEEMHSVMEKTGFTFLPRHDADPLPIIGTWMR